MADSNVTPQQFFGKYTPGILIAVIILLPLIIGGFTSFYTINANELGVVARFGKYHSTVEQGLNWKLPFGIDRVFRVTQTVQTEEFGYRTLQSGVNSRQANDDYSSESVMLTGDLNIVDVQWTLKYLIVDPQAWLFNVDDSRIDRMDNRKKTLRDITQSVMSKLVGDRTIQEVITQERENIEFLAVEQTQQILDSYDIGVKVSLVQLQQVEAPKGEVQDAVEDVNKAIQDRDRLINEGEQAYYTEILRLEGEARQIVDEAQGNKEARINRARGEIALYNAIYAEYRNSPRVTRDRLYYETISEILADEENVDIIDKNLQNFLPLKNLDSQTGGLQ